ncbi:transposase [Streptomyces sp. NPDC001599]|uniref:transposase n=1 Tax=Streptomyces sp. NPDC001599 TaxID=3364591 RepID=UPI00367CF5D9
MGRRDLSDAEWERLRPFMPVSNGRCGRWRNHRQVIDGIAHRIRTGCSGVTFRNVSGRGRRSMNGAGCGRPAGLFGGCVVVVVCGVFGVGSGVEWVGCLSRSSLRVVRGQGGVLVGGGGRLCGCFGVGGGFEGLCCFKVCAVCFAVGVPGGAGGSAGHCRGGGDGCVCCAGGRSGGIAWWAGFSGRSSRWGWSWSVAGRSWLSATASWVPGGWWCFL